MAAPTSAAQQNRIVEAILATIRQRESGNNYRAQNGTSSASGAYQFIDSTWHGLGGTGHAKDASPAVQDMIARKYVLQILNANNWDVTAVPKTWYTGGAWRSHSDSWVPPGNSTSVGDYTSGWLHTFNGYTNGSVPIPASGGGTVEVMGGGSGISTSTVTNSTGPQAGESVDQYARRTYGYLGWFLDHPEIGPIIRQAAAEGWDLGRLQGALASTTWWRTTSESARTWEARLASDPADAEAQVRARVAEIEDIVGTLGITIDPNKVYSMAVDTLRFGVDPQSAQFRNTLASNLPQYGATADPGHGTFDQAYEEIKRLARAEYMVGIADSDAWTMAQQVVAGSLTMDGVKSMFMQQSRGRFSQITDILDQGITPGQFFAPYRNAIAEELEMSADQVNLLDPRWSSVINTTGADGKQRPMTFTEVQRFARQQPEWENTGRGRDQGAAMARTLITSMGKAVL